MENEKSAPQNTKGDKEKLLLTIEEKQYEWKNQYITGSQIKQLAGIPLEVDVFLSIKEPWEDELVPNDEKVNLARPSIEHFFVKQKLKLTINKKPFFWYNQYITGQQIRVLGKIDSDDDIYLEIKEPYKDELILDETSVDLARPSVEHFISKPRKIQIFVGGMPHEWIKPKISFKEVIILAYGKYIDSPNMVYTIGYEDGPKQNVEGSMFIDKEVFVTNNMIFHATATDKS